MTSSIRGYPGCRTFFFRGPDPPPPHPTRRPGFPFRHPLAGCRHSHGLLFEKLYSRRFRALTTVRTHGIGSRNAFSANLSGSTWSPLQSTCFCLAWRARQGRRYDDNLDALLILGTNSAGKRDCLLFGGSSNYVIRQGGDSITSYDNLNGGEQSDIRCFSFPGADYCTIWAMDGH